MDVFSKAKRSEVMSRIRGRGNRSTERRMAAMLRAKGISGWRMHRKDVPGIPDFFFEDLGIALFIDGCFWHACPKCSTMPSQNRDFWSQKLTKNVARDKRVRRLLNRTGIKVIRLPVRAVQAPGPGQSVMMPRSTTLAGSRSALRRQRG
jgi:DNA mismatch endonuclease (patch repair protein)